MKNLLSKLGIVMMSLSTAAVATSSQASDRDAFAAATAAAREANMTAEPIAAGPFQPTWESLKQYQTPEWYRDAKFGIWAHWGPQCQPEQGDWYAKRMYEQGAIDKKTGEFKINALYKWHVEHYGHPSTFGFKDVINTWHAENWDPDKLMALYKRAGAQYFMALANHHDNTDLWDSKYQPWNSVNLGPKKDLIGGWEKAARKEGLRFAVSVHGSRPWTWYESAQGADVQGDLKGVPYDGKLTAADGKGLWWDGLDPQDLYAQNHPPGHANWEWKPNPPATQPNDPRVVTDAYITKFYNRTVDLVNKYHPDMVYFDDTVLPLYPVSDIGLKFAAHFYNSNMALHGGKLEAVINGKHLDDEQKKCLVYDIERGKSQDILPFPWQTDTCIGGWHYQRSIFDRHTYKKSGDVIRMLIDIVSKNGNLMLNIPLRGDGTPDEDELKVLEDLATWMDVNSQAIFATRPWKVYGEGPSVNATHEKGQFDGIKDVTKLTAEDVRFTASKDGKTLYALVLGWPETGAITLTSLAAGAKDSPTEIGKVTLLGSQQDVTTSRDDKGLTLTFSTPKPAEALTAACVFKIELK